MSKIIVLLLFSFPIASFAQDEVKTYDYDPIEKDLELWMELSFEKDITKDLELNFSEGLRLKNNLRELKGILSEISLSYELWDDHLKLEGGYRLDLDGEVENRIFANTKLEHEWNPLVMEWRSQVQREYQRAELPENHWRNKFTLQYLTLDEIINPYIGAEVFYRLWHQSNITDEYRLFAGLDWHTGDNTRLSFTYIFKNEFNIRKPEQVHVMSVQYKVNF